MAELLNRLTELYRGADGVLRESMIAASCLAVGLVVMPCLMFAVGRLVLGPYAHGGVFALWRDYLAGLGSGAKVFWFIAAGPYLFVWLFRGGRRLLHR